MTTQAKQILVVEDDRFLRHACAASLRQHGWTVLTAVDGEEALGMTRTEAVDLIQLEMLMPKVRGLEVIRTLKADEKPRALAVLILSNSSREQDVQEVMRLGAVGYLVKANLFIAITGRSCRPHYWGT